MPVLKPVKGHFFVKWLRPSFYDVAAQLECYSCELFFTERRIHRLMTGPRCDGLVLTDLKKPVAYILYRRHKQGGREMMHLINLVVHPEYRQQGFGTLLLNQAKARTRRHGLSMMIASVRESNTGMHIFLKKNGFRACKVLKEFYVDHYPDSTEKETAYGFMMNLTDREVSVE
jgi:ribosomal-protein-alanine N-acetyltransferase